MWPFTSWPITVQAHVLFFEPTGGVPAEWSTSALWAIAKRLPSTQVYTDRDGLLAQHFGAYTSGQVLLYDSQDQLRFAGGITPSRGHTGDNPGRAAVIKALL